LVWFSLFKKSWRGQNALKDAEIELQHVRNANYVILQFLNALCIRKLHVKSSTINIRAIRKYSFLALTKIRLGKANVEFSGNDLQYLYSGIQETLGNESNALS
jgi:hypothetical protein